jgi:hypothetical protein
MNISLASSVEDREYDSRSWQIINYKIGTYCFSTIKTIREGDNKHTVFVYYKFIVISSKKYLVLTRIYHQIVHCVIQQPKGQSRMDNSETLATLSTQDTGRGQTKQKNVRENWRGNQEWTIQRHWQHWVHKTQGEDKQNKKQKTKRIV